MTSQRKDDENGGHVLVQPTQMELAADNAEPTHKRKSKCYRSKLWTMAGKNSSRG